MSASPAQASRQTVPVIPKRRKKKRSANDIPLNPASPEVISNLLASFSAISLPPDEQDQAYPALSSQSPAPSIGTYPSQQYPYPRPRSSRDDPRSSRDGSLDVPPSSYLYDNHTVFNSVPEEDEEEDGDAAEAPVISTSRQPSSKSGGRASAWKFRSPYSSRNTQRHASQASQQREDGDSISRLSSLTSLSRERSGFASPHTLSGRPSFDSRRDTGRAASMTAITLTSQRSGGDIRNDFARLHSLSSVTRPPGTADSMQSNLKGKSRAQAVTPVQGLSNHNSRPQSSSRHPASTNSAQPRESPSTARSRPPADAIGDDTGFIILHPPKSNPTIVTPERARVSPSYEHPSIPSRTASLRGSKSSKSPGSSDRLREGSLTSPGESLQAQATSADTRALSRKSSAETVFLDTQLEGKSPFDKTEAQNKDDLEEESEVTRRIRELRAANERRRKDYAESSREVSPLIEQKTWSSAGASPPQFGRDGAMLGLPAADSLMPPELPLKHSMSNSTAKSASLSPAISRSSSRSRRWAGSELAKAVTSPGSLHRRGNSKDSNKHYNSSPPLDEGRSSTDSVREHVDAFLSSAKLSRKLPALDDPDRQIAFSDIGDSQGHVVFCCLGMGLTRYVTAYYEELALSLGLRLITPDRPGVGDSTAYRNNLNTPLNWPDDVRAICRYLAIEEFSILAHSAGAIYALATALRMPHRIRGNIHLLAPWIPPSQMTNIGIPSANNSPSALPRSQRFLRLLPTSLLKLSNSSLLSSRSIVGGSGRKSSSNSRKSSDTRNDSLFTSPRPSMGGPGRWTTNNTAPHSLFSSARASGRTSFEHRRQLTPLDEVAESAPDFSMATMVMDASFPAPQLAPLGPQDVATRQQRYDQALTPAVWELATRKANPAVDLLVCLERHHKIGYRYADVSHPIIIHHGSKDTRVPLENIKWVANTLQRAEVRVLDGEGHSLMASATVISAVLVEIAREVEKKRPYGRMR